MAETFNRVQQLYGWRGSGLYDGSIYIFDLDSYSCVLCRHAGGCGALYLRGAGLIFMDIVGVTIWLAVVMTFASGALTFFDSNVGNLCWHNEVGVKINCAGSGILGVGTLDAAQINTQINGKDANDFIASSWDLNIGGKTSQSSATTAQIPILTKLGKFWDWLVGGVFAVMSGIFKWGVILHAFFDGFGIKGLIDWVVVGLAMLQMIGIGLLVKQLLEIFKL